MFRRIVCLLSVITGLCACAATPVQVDTPIWADAATLKLAEGLPRFPTYIGVPGYVMVAGQISMLPGNKRIFYACPGDWEWKTTTHFIPYVDFDFESRQFYELRCDGSGYPEIRPLGENP